MIRGNGAAAIRAMGRLDHVIEELGRLPRKLAIEAAPRITRALQSQFRQGVDPYGSPWAPLSPNTRGRKPPPLTDTGKLKQGTKARPGIGGRAGLHLVLGAEYGIFHQTGTRNMPARRILPTRGMPAEWRGILESRARMLARRAERVS